VYEANPPYNTRGTADTSDATDGIYQQAGGSQGILTMKKQGSGYLGTITMGVAA
jgi:hypothetical protein